VGEHTRGGKDLIRDMAKRYKVDVLMLGNHGNGRVIVDVEPYRSGTAEKFHGLLERLGLTQEQWDASSP
jgi:hypothetical protein